MSEGGTPWGRRRRRGPPASLALRPHLLFVAVFVGVEVGVPVRVAVQLFVTECVIHVAVAVCEPVRVWLPLRVWVGDGTTVVELEIDTRVTDAVLLMEALVEAELLTDAVLDTLAVEVVLGVLVCVGGGRRV